MPGAIDIGRSLRKQRTGSFGGVLSAGGDSIESLQQQIALLEQEQAEFGAPGVDIDQPGFLARTVDVLSGFNFAFARAASEIQQGNGIAAALGGATAELYSSARSLPLGQLLPKLGNAEKREFSQLLEDIGYDTTSLADVIPALEGTFIGELFNTRGTAGLALNILADPLTYVTFGFSAAAKQTLKAGTRAGTKFLSKAGRAKIVAREKELLESAGLANRSLTRAELITAGSIKDQAKDEVFGLIEDGAKELIDPGGIKFWGKVIPGTPGLGSAFAKKVTSAANKFPFGQRVLAESKKLKDGIRDSLAAVFSSHERLLGLPPQMREAGEQIARKYEGSSTLLRLRYHARLTTSGFMKYAEKHPERGELMINVRQGVKPKSALRPGEETAAFEEMAQLFDELGAQGVAAGVLEPEQMLKGYFAHFYNNPADDFSEVWSAWTARYARVSGKHAKQKVFDTLFGENGAVEISDQLNKITVAMNKAGQNVPVYPLLKPRTDIADVTARYVNWHVDQITRRAMAKEMSEVFGKAADEFNMDAVFDLATPQTTGRELLKIRKWFKDKDPVDYFVVEAFEEHTDTYTRHLAGRPIDKLDEDLVSAFNTEVTREVDRWTNPIKFMKTLTDDGKREFMRRVFRGTKSDSQFVDRAFKEFSEFEEFFPNARVDLSGSTEPALRSAFGEKAKYVHRTGAIWSDQPRGVFVPSAIADFVERANSSVFNTQEFAALRKGLRKWDFVNKWFKIGNYAFWPASFVRDSMTNVAFMSYRMGLDALNPVAAKEAIGVMIAGRRGAAAAARHGFGDITTKTGLRVSPMQMFDEAARRNVTLTPGQLLEFKDDAYRIVKKNRLARSADKVLQIRANLENTQRMHMFTQLVKDGLSFDDAAGEVAKFMFNYNEISAFHRDVLRRMFPFVTFTIKNIELHANQLLRNPGLVINQLKPFRGRTDENEMMVKWEAEGLKMRINKDGKTVQMLTGVDLPVRNLDVLWRGSIGSTLRGVGGMLAPLLKAPVEQATNKDLFTNRNLTRQQSDGLGRFIDTVPTPQAIKDWIGYKREIDAAGRKKYTFDGLKAQFLGKSWAFSRVMSTTDRQFREYADDGQWARSFLDVATGFRMKELDLTDQKRRLLQIRIRQLEESLARRGRRGTFRRTFTPKGDANALF